MCLNHRELEEMCLLVVEEVTKIWDPPAIKRVISKGKKNAANKRNK